MLNQRRPACYHCRYDLSNLPERGRCPECGNHYGPDIEPPLSRTDIAIQAPEALEKGVVEAWPWLVDRFMPSFRTLAIAVFILGSSAIVILLGKLAWDGLMRKAGHFR